MESCELECDCGCDVVGIVLDMMVHKSDTSVDKGRGGKEKKVFVIGLLEKNPKTKVGQDGIDMLSMAVPILRRMCFGVAGSFREVC